MKASKRRVDEECCMKQDEKFNENKKVVLEKKKLRLREKE